MENKEKMEKRIKKYLLSFEDLNIENRGYKVGRKTKKNIIKNFKYARITGYRKMEKSMMLKNDAVAYGYIHTANDEYFFNLLSVDQGIIHRITEAKNEIFEGHEIYEYFTGKYEEYLQYITTINDDKLRNKKQTLQDECNCLQGEIKKFQNTIKRLKSEQKNLQIAISKSENKAKESNKRIEKQTVLLEEQKISLEKIEAIKEEKSRDLERYNEESDVWENHIEELKERADRLKNKIEQDQRSFNEAKDRNKREFEEMSRSLENNIEKKKVQYKADFEHRKSELKADFEKKPLQYLLENLFSQFDQSNHEALAEQRETVFKLLDQFQKKVAELYQTTVDRLNEIPEDILRVNQIEALLDTYTDKIKKVKNDSSLDDDEKTMKISYWENLRDSHIAGLQRGQD